MNYTEWTAQARGIADALSIPMGSPDFGITVWPPKFADGHAGEPAVRLSNTAYVQAFNAGLLPTDGTRDDGNGYIYVLATAMTGDDDVVNTSPHIMTTAERIANDLFTKGDQTAAALGLPSLDSIQGALKAAAFVGVALVALSFMRKR